MLTGRHILSWLHVLASHVCALQRATNISLELCMQALQAGAPAALAAPSLLATAASALGPGPWPIPTGQHALGRRKLKRPQTSCKGAPQVAETPLDHPAPLLLPPAPSPPPTVHPSATSHTTCTQLLSVWCHCLYALLTLNHPTFH